MRSSATSRIFGAFVGALLVWTLTGSKADAAVVIYRVEWAGAIYGNSAHAVALIGIETLDVPNPGAHLDNEPRTMPAWLVSIELAVTGESGIAGLFSRDDFEGVFWDTEGATLDLASELVGQPTDQLPWGTSSDSRSGDFNLFRAAGDSTSPSGTRFFELTAYSETAEYPMKLVSFRPVPEPASWLLVVLGSGWIVLLRRRS